MPIKVEWTVEQPQKQLKQPPEDVSVSLGCDALRLCLIAPCIFTYLLTYLLKQQ